MQVDYIFDFASPNAYLVHQVLPEIAARTGAQFNYLPCLLGGIFKSTGNQSPWQMYAHIPTKMAYEQLEFKRFVQKHKITKFTMNPHFPVNTITLMRGACAAHQEGRDALMKYIDIVFHAMWEEPQNLNDPNIVTQMLVDAGYSPEEFLAKTQNNEIKETLKKNTDSAVTRGAFGIPTFYVGDQMFYGKERLGQLEEEIIKQSA